MTTMRLSSASRKEQLNSRVMCRWLTWKTYKLSSTSHDLHSSLIRYTEKQKFGEHFDWFDPLKPDSIGPPGNRVSSFFVYLLADCKGGTTMFPEVWRPEGQEWCTDLKCNEENGQEVRWLEVLPKVGTAIFWHNLDPRGMVDKKTLNAGSAVINGTKIGLNIWTRERAYRNQ